MTNKKIWYVSRGWLDVYEDEEPIAVYKNEGESKGWNPDCILDGVEDKRDAIAFYEEQRKTLEHNEKGREIAVLTECDYGEDEELGGEFYCDYKDLAIAVGE